jgi:hypothetical protein
VHPRDPSTQPNSTRAADCPSAPDRLFVGDGAPASAGTTSRLSRWLLSPPSGWVHGRPPRASS